MLVSQIQLLSVFKHINQVDQAFILIRMVKNLLVGACQASLLILAIFAFLAQTSNVPAPTCSSPHYGYKDLPISLQESQTFNLDDIFSGYNLSFSISNKPNFTFLHVKFMHLESINQPQPGLRNYNMEGQTNQWGNTLVTLSVEESSTIVRWGVPKGIIDLPNLSNQAIVENDTSVYCFDAVWIRSKMILLVDCVQNSTFGLKNYYYYLNSTTKETLGNVENDMHVPFSQIRKRKIRLHYENEYLYLFRAYFAEAVDDAHMNNTYAEFISLQNPLKPWTVRVMDRSFLGQDKLAITDFEVYLGDVYLLDYFSGVIKFGIPVRQIIYISGRYNTDSGFTRLGVYSRNLDNQYTLVLANSHIIQEVDLSNQIHPLTVTKYTIPDNSLIHDIWVNQMYVVAQLSADLTNDKKQTNTYHSTYVFTRKTRTYTNAYVVIPHENPQTFVDLNRGNNLLLIIDTQGLSFYLLSNPSVTFMPIRPQFQDDFNVTIKAESVHENDSFFCTFTFRYIIVAADSYAIWPTFLTIPKSYYVNYPGQIFIPLERYALGANMSYGIDYQQDQSTPRHYILHQNSTKIFWKDKLSTNSKYTIVVAEQYDSLDETDIYLYTQDAQNVTYFSLCKVVPYTEKVYCWNNLHAPNINFKIRKLVANRFHVYGGKYAHLAAILFQQLTNQIFVYNVQQDGQLQVPPIIFPKGYEGKVENIEFLGNYLVVVLKYVKEIVIYDIATCIDYVPNLCKQMYRIDTRMMNDLGVNYFSPIDVFASDFHPFVLFIQCLDRVLILDITRQGPIKLAEFKSPATQEPGEKKWKMAIAKRQIILIKPPSSIQEHDLEQLYIRGNVPFNRKYPTYGYVIPDNFQVDFSDKGNLVYITGIDKQLHEGKNTVVMVYRSGYPSVASFYDVFHLNATYQDMLLQVTGNFGDYVTVAYGNELKMFRQYEIPILVFKDVFGDFTFNVTYTNDPKNRFYYTSQSTIFTANYPEDIIINSSELNKTDYLTQKVNDTDTSTFSQIDDSTWFNGSIINYTLDGEKCPECTKKINIINHIEQERILLGAHDMSDYTFTFDGGYIQQYQSIIKIHHNGSIDQLIRLPTVQVGEVCSHIEHNSIYDYTISACKSQESGKQEVFLYLTVFSASKPFVNGPYLSSAKHVTSMHVVQEILIIVDVDDKPWSFAREGSVIIYAVNHDPLKTWVFDELQFIDSTDLGAAYDWPGGPCFIGNAHLAFTKQADTYRLLISQLRNGFFIVDFKWTRGRKSVEILKIEFVNLAQELFKISLPMPNAAFFTAVAINNQYYQPTFKYWQSQFIIATNNFHSFQINLYLDRTGLIVFYEIAKIFYRYGFYQTENYIKAYDGYFAIAQRLPAMLQIFDKYSEVVLSVYDTKDTSTFNKVTGQNELQTRYLEGTNIPVVYMLGGYAINGGTVKFDWNFTSARNSSDPLRRLGLLAVNDKIARIWQLSVNQKLIIYSQQGIQETQEGFLVARNDLHQVKVPIKLIVEKTSLPTTIFDYESYPGQAIAIVGCLVVGVAIGLLAYNKFIKAKAHNTETETEKSLLQREGKQDDIADISLNRQAIKTQNDNLRPDKQVQGTSE